ncbi:nickel ABC transporter permease [Sphaerobacter thermophilus]|uniref:Binding-protein-dependent transport systems inner membrane component n=1 Tax=Sphaerobacter thermophilus (strain ATCC 49802 / DSM 20745 / KCCM 41009 / NCIMB 13125 / S 6022) TaxID=479434 RepID=D1C6T9_SPHTD|nr:nickel ABC transporter permease [Sphaerobacter thermophilus]ACZ37700.1 binding-protein-dependent transport systems inner membrane component [Sphaerobacter thermophilus DSM 20745]
MTAYIIRRLLTLIPTLLGVSLLVFSITRLTPGDPVRQIVGPDAPQQRVDEVRRQLGLDQPILVQYWKFLTGAVRGDLGRSLLTRQPVVKELQDRLPVTLKIATISVIIAVVIGIPLGVISAARKYSAVDTLATLFAIGGVSMPLFWFAIMAILLFSIRLQWLPVGGLHGPIWTFEGMKAYVLPCITLALTSIALIARLTRSSMLEVLDREYVTVARAKGLEERRVIIRHALRNALLPVVTFVGLQYGFLLGGAVVTETIFALPGVGRLAIQAINQRDYPVIQGVVLMVAVIFTMINLIVDVLYAWLDPRISYA